MTYVYLNYPNRRAMLHHDSSCESIRQTNKRDQRTARINLASISSELQKFTDKKYSFAANQSQNDIWLEIEFQDAEFEEAVAVYVIHLAGKYYKPLNDN